MNVLILGNGTGTYATQCERYFENMEISGVEIDQKITDLAVQYFEHPEDVEVTTYDGRAYFYISKRAPGRSWCYGGQYEYAGQ